MRGDQSVSNVFGCFCQDRQLPQLPPEFVSFHHRRARMQRADGMSPLHQHLCVQCDNSFFQRGINELDKNILSRSLDARRKCDDATAFSQSGCFATFHVGSTASNPLESGP